MLKHAFTLLCWLISGVCLAQTSPAENPSRPEVIVGFYEFPPWIYSDAEGNIHGPLLTLQQQLIERSGYRPRFRSLPSPRLYNGLRDGSVHLWMGASGKEELAGYTLESNSLLGHTNLNLYYPAHQPEPRIPEDLRNKHIILISGYTYWPSVNQLLQDPALNIQTHRTSNHDSALQMLERKRGDYLINYESPVRLLSHNHTDMPLKSVVLDRLPIRFIASRQAPNAEHLLWALDRSVEQLRQEGLYPMPRHFH